MANLVSADPDDVLETSTPLIDFPDGDGELQPVNFYAAPDNAILDNIYRNIIHHNQYFLYTRRNPRQSQKLIINKVHSITNSNFNANVPTVVIVHGWLSSKETEINPTIRDACLFNNDVNVIVVDWKRLAHCDYVTACKGVPTIGRNLGKFLAFLNSVAEASYDTMHLVGFSLGAHVVGNAGKELDGKVARITGLDPAGPLWNMNPDRLNSNDAKYVEAIHTDAGVYGIATAIANADFFPNGGSSQPGAIGDVGNHNRSWQLFAATVTYNHLIGLQCSSIKDVHENIIDGGNTLPMGNDDINKFGTGLYRLDTSAVYPY